MDQGASEHQREHAANPCAFEPALRKLIQDAKDEVLLDETLHLRGQPSGLDFASILAELAKIAAYRQLWLQADAGLTEDVELAMMQRIEALASAASLCEARTTTDVYVLIAFAEHLIDTSVGFRGAIDIARFQLGQRLQQRALRALRQMGALAGHRADLTDAFCPAREEPFFAE